MIDQGQVPERVHIVGLPGSGKTTLARMVAAKTGALAHDLDDVDRSANGAISADPATRNQEKWDYLTRQAGTIASGDRWVTEGIFSGWTAPLVERAERVVWLDLPASLAVRRIVWRHLCRSLAGNNMHKGLRGLAAFCRWVWDDPERPAASDVELQANSGSNSRATVQERLDPILPKVIRCRTAADVTTLMNEWELEISQVRGV